MIMKTRTAAKEEAAKTDAERARQAVENLRAQLLDQFNRILETRDTQRGAVIAMNDTLRDAGRTGAESWSSPAK